MKVGELPESSKPQRHRAGLARHHWTGAAWCHPQENQHLGQMGSRKGRKGKFPLFQVASLGRKLPRVQREATKTPCRPLLPSSGQQPQEVLWVPEWARLYLFQSLPEPRSNTADTRDNVRLSYSPLSCLQHKTLFRDKNGPKREGRSMLHTCVLKDQ